MAGLIMSTPGGAQTLTAEQMELLNTLSASQREAVLRQLAGGATAQDLVDQQGRTEQPIGFPRVVIPEPETETELAPKLSIRDTLVIEFEPREEATSPDATNDERDDLEAFRERLAAGNPYQLDDAGYLYLPGVEAVALAGLNIEEATVRLRAVRALAVFELTLTRLPLEPVGVAALERFGYDLFSGSPTTFAPATDIPVPTNYVMGPGDNVMVQLFGSENARYRLIVTREGVINFPEIGPLNVAGITFERMRDLIDQRVAAQMIGVQASTTLGELRSIRVFVLGDVQNPGSYTVSGLSTITHALFVSGGVSEIGSLRRIQLRRNGRTVRTLDLYDLLLAGDTRNDVRLLPGDVIFVPTVGATVAVDGQVKRPAIYEIDGENTVAEVIALSGGLLPGANAQAVKLERIVPGRGMTVRDIDSSGAAGAAAETRDGDILRVLSNLPQLEDSVRLEGNVYQPGLYEWYPGMRLSDLLPSSELVKPSSDLNYVLIRRENEPNVDIEAISVDLEAVWRRRAGANDIELRPRDTVNVFSFDIGRQHVVEPILAELEVQAAPGEATPVVSVGGQVRAGGRYPLEPGMTIGDLLRAGGGLTAAAYSLEAELVRYVILDGEARQTELIEIDLASLIAGNAEADALLTPYDVVNIRQIPNWSERGMVSILGEVRFPGDYPIRQGETLSSVLARAGGLAEFAFPQGSVFTRVELREREREQLQVLQRRIRNDLAAMALSDADATDALSTGQSLLDQIQSMVPTGRLVVNIDELLAGDVAFDITLRDGDRLIVPQTTQEVTVIGEVQSPTSHLYRDRFRQSDYIDLSGGTTARADKKRVYVVRADGSVAPVSRSKWFRRSSNTDIEPGDTIVAPLDLDRGRAIARWGGITQILYNLAIAAAAVQSF